MTIPPFLVVVAGEHPAMRIATAAALTLDASADVVVVDDLAMLADAVEHRMPDVVVSDSGLVAGGLELVERLRSLAPGVGFVVQAQQPSLEHAIAALRARVDEFFPNEIDDDHLRRAVREVASRAQRRRRADGGRVVLAVGAAAGDVEMGVGGALLAHVAAGDTVVLLAMSNDGDPVTRSARRAASRDAAARLGARIVLEECAASEVTAETARSTVERIVATVSPSIVYTHSASDQDRLHRIVHDAVIAATPDAQRIATFQSHASTIDFAPTGFVDLDDVLDRKVDVIEAYAGVAADAARLDPVLARTSAVYWSRFSAARRSEPFELVRDAGAVAAHLPTEPAQPAAVLH